MASDRNLINAFDDCVQRLESGENLDDILKDYPESADYLRDLLMISEMVHQVHDEDDAQAAQSRGRERLQQELKLKEKPKRRITSRHPRWYLATAAAAVFVLMIGFGFLTMSLMSSSNPNLDISRTSIAQQNTTTEALIRATQTQMSNNVEGTTIAEANVTLDTDISLTQTLQADYVAQTLTATQIPFDPFELTATNIIQNATDIAVEATRVSGIAATPTLFVENGETTATALLMPTITLVGTPIPPTLPRIMASAIPTSVASLPQSTAEPPSLVEVAQMTATALTELFYQSTPTLPPVGGGSSTGTTTGGSGNELPDTGGGNGVDNAIKTTSMPFPTATLMPTGTSTATPSPVPTQTALSTQVANADVFLTEPAENNVQATALPALIPLSAGEIDDNADWDRYLLYRREFLTRGIPVYDLDVTGRQIISVVDNQGLPVLGAKVRIFANGEAVAEASTYATGQTMFFPNLDERTKGVNEFFVTVEKGGVSEQFMLNRDESTSWTVTLPLTINRDAVTLDVLFLIDTTGSMSDEISQLQNNILHISSQIDELAVDIRYGLVAYRDFPDAYVTQTAPFVSDVGQFQLSLNQLIADGGGDKPEALNTALAVTLNEMEWRGDDTIKLVFLVADAEPHINLAEESARYDTAIQEALARGIKIHPIASSGLEQAGEYIFRQIAQVTMGHFLFLTYEDGVPGTTGDIRPELNVGTPETIDPDDGYTVDRLADLVLRLIQDEINTYRGILRP